MGISALNSRECFNQEEVKLWVNVPFSFPMLWVCLARFGWGGVYRGGFCEKLPEASPMYNGATASQL